MPHKREPKVRAMADQVRTLRDLAEALGVTDDTVTAWKRRGMPAGPPYSVVATYLWAKAQGLNAQMPKDAALRALIGQADVEDDGPVGALPGHSAYDRLLRSARPKTYAQALEREKLIEQEEKNAALRRESAVRQGQLVTREDADKGAAAVRDAFVTAGAQLVQGVVALLPADMKASHQTAATAAVGKAWDDLVARIGVDG